MAVAIDFTVYIKVDFHGVIMHKARNILKLGVRVLL